MDGHCTKIPIRNINQQLPQANHGHPCFSPAGHGKAGRIHLAVAPKCNISCNYCVRKFDCANESRPGVTSKVIGPEEALQRVKDAKQSKIGNLLNVVGIAGPGDPLVNDATFETLALVKEKFPELTLCLSTNGLLLPNKVEKLVELGVTHVTVTLNTLDKQIAARIYSFVEWNNQKLKGSIGTEILLENQLIGIKLASQAGLTVKVNTVVIPGINDHQLETLAKEVKRRGAKLHNLMPLIPQGKFVYLNPPTRQELVEYRERLGVILPQMKHCQQCRADAVGLV